MILRQTSALNLIFVGFHCTTGNSNLGGETKYLVLKMQQYDFFFKSVEL